MADAQRLRTIKIKTGVVKRTAKDKTSYEKEANQHKEKEMKMKEEGKDKHDIKKAEEVTQESLSMVTDSKKRLRPAIDELKAILDDPKNEDLKESEEYRLAQEALTDAETIYNQ